MRSETDQAMLRGGDKGLLDRPLLYGFSLALNQVDCGQPLILQIAYDASHNATLSITEEALAIPNASLRQPPGQVEVELERIGKPKVINVLTPSARVGANPKLCKAIASALVYLDRHGDLSLPVRVKARENGKVFSIVVEDMPLVPDAGTRLTVTKSGTVQKAEGLR
ncbi:MAG TPA: hypothetical protein VK934_03295 [Fimbriimonas sp.]|nr:hypothetical protein [Fimbriimonas sp.]